jgi:hypothetical protein
MKKIIAIVLVSFSLSSVALPAMAGGTDDLNYPDWAKCALDPHYSSYC